MLYLYLTTFFNQVREKMYADIVAIVREMKKHEAQSKILNKSERYQRANAMRAFNAKQKQINNKKVQIQRTRHK